MQAVSRSALVAFVASVVIIGALNGLASVEIDRPKNLNQLYEVAKQLESTKMQLSEQPSSRNKMVFGFIRESKSEHCDRHYKQLKKTVEEYRAKAYTYITDSKNTPGWLNGIKKLVGPLGSMKNLAKFDSYLVSVTNRYELQTKAGILTERDVDCDMTELQIQNLDRMLFVLKTDLKYLVTESPQVNTIAIYRHLAENNFKANNNFYDIDEKSDSLRKLVQDFYSTYVDPEIVPISEALKHINPGNLIMARLLDSCRNVVDYSRTLGELKETRKEICPQSKLNSENGIPAEKSNQNGDEKVVEFCDQLLNSL